MFILLFYCLYIIILPWDLFGLRPLFGKVTLFTSRMRAFSFYSLFIFFLLFMGLLTHSVPSPLHRACNTTQYNYKPGQYFPTIRSLLGHASVNPEFMHPIARAVCRVALVYFSRVSELLRLTINDIINPDRVFCSGLKHSHSYLIYLPGITKQVSALSSSDASLRIFPISYVKCYRSYVRAGIRLSVPNRKNVARCHIGRYQVSSLASKGYSKDALSDVLHHRRKSSISYYLT